MASGATRRPKMPTDPLAEFLISHAQAIVRLHQRGKADGFDLTPADLGTALHRSVRAWDGGAKPAASCPTASSFCDCRSCSSKS